MSDQQRTLLFNNRTYDYPKRKTSLMLYHLLSTYNTAMDKRTLMALMKHCAPEQGSFRLSSIYNVSRFLCTTIVLGESYTPIIQMIGFEMPTAQYRFTRKQMVAAGSCLGTYDPDADRRLHLTRLPPRQDRTLTLLLTRSTCHSRRKTDSIKARVGRAMLLAIQRDLPQLLHNDIVRVPNDDNDGTDCLLHTLFQKHLWLHHDLVGVARNAWPSSPTSALSANVIKTLLSCGELVLNIITLHVANISVNIDTITDLKDVNHLEVNLHIATNPRYSRLLNIPNPRNTWPHWIETNLDGLESAIRRTSSLERPPTSDIERWTYGTYALRKNSADRYQHRLQKRSDVYPAFVPLSPDDYDSRLWAATKRNDTSSFIDHDAGDGPGEETEGEDEDWVEDINLYMASIGFVIGQRQPGGNQSIYKVLLYAYKLLKVTIQP
jgi:hypothetical protein